MSNTYNSNVSNGKVSYDSVQTAYINGAYLPVDESLTTFDTINPATGEVIAKIQQTTSEQVDEAFKQAKKGKKSGPA